ncbi:hypothetical protein ACHAQA_008180 [Verticillium albo-atrum]
MADASSPAKTSPVGAPEGGWKAAHGWRMPDEVEPVLIVSILLLAMWFTRRKDFSILRRSKTSYEPLLDDAHAAEIQFDNNDDDDVNPIRTNQLHPPKVRRILGCVRVQTPNSSRFAKHPHSRILQKFPFLIEMFYWAITFFFYRMTAVLAQVHYGTVKELWKIAQAHGLTLLEAEASLFGQNTAGREGPWRWVEWRIERWFLLGAQAGDFRGVWLTILNRGYALIHIPGTVGFIAYYYALAPTHARFCTVRRTMTLCNLFAFCIFVTYPTCPPRLLPSELGFVDTVNLENAESVWMSGNYVNKLAAMPSMHFGYAFCIGCVFVADSGVLNGLFARLGRLIMRDHRDDDVESKTLNVDEREVQEIQERRSPWVRLAMFAFGVWYPCWILLTIVATANHYFLDAFVATFVVLCAYLANRLLLNFLPAEDLLLWAWRLEKPVPTTGRMKNVVVR